MEDRAWEKARVSTCSLLPLLGVRVTERMRLLACKLDPDDHRLLSLPYPARHALPIVPTLGAAPGAQP